MLRRTKYSRLHNDSLPSLEDGPKKNVSLKRDLCLGSDFALLDPGTPSHHEPSTLRDFIPRVANLRLQSPISLHGLRGGVRVTSRDGTTDGPTDRPLSQTEWDLGPNQRLCSQPCLSEPLPTNSALSGTKRPITLHQMDSLPWTLSCPPCAQHRDGQRCLKTSSAGVERAAMWAAHRAVHHDIKVQNLSPHGAHTPIRLGVCGFFV